MKLGSRWIVYSAGTADFGVTPATEPYDTTSNVHMVAASAGLPVVDGGGERAIRQAMDQAGVAPGDPILLVGHSGGGLAIANLAADPSRNVVAAVSLVGLFERPGPLVELAVYVGLGILWALPFRFVFLGVARDDPGAPGRGSEGG